MSKLQTSWNESFFPAYPTKQEVIEARQLSERSLKHQAYGARSVHLTRMLTTQVTVTLPKALAHARAQIEFAQEFGHELLAIQLQSVEAVLQENLRSLFTLLEELKVANEEAAADIAKQSKEFRKLRRRKSNQSV